MAKLAARMPWAVSRTSTAHAETAVTSMADARRQRTLPSLDAGVGISDDVIAAPSLSPHGRRGGSTGSSSLARVAGSKGTSTYRYRQPRQRYPLTMTFRIGCYSLVAVQSSASCRAATSHQLDIPGPVGYGGH